MLNKGRYVLYIYIYTYIYAHIYVYMCVFIKNSIFTKKKILSLGRMWTKRENIILNWVNVTKKYSVF